MKQNRHQKIAELVSRYEIETQEELAEKLKEAGFTVTQATISRDIRQMNLSKLPTGNGRQKYVILKKENELLSDKYIRVLGRLCVDGYGAEYFGHADGFRNGDGSGGCAGCHSFRGSGRLYRRR